jgi:hypothetical protein
MTKAKQNVKLIDEEILLAAIRDAAKEIIGSKVTVTDGYITISAPHTYLSYRRRSTGYECTYDSDYRMSCETLHRSVERQYKAHDAVRHLRRQGYVGIKIDSKPSEARIRVTARRV